MASSIISTVNSAASTVKKASSKVNTAVAAEKARQEAAARAKAEEQAAMARAAAMAKSRPSAKPNTSSLVTNTTTSITITQNKNTTIPISTFAYNIIGNTSTPIYTQRSTPPASSGYELPKGMKNGNTWNKSLQGHLDKYGNVWRYDKSRHGGEHWDVQYPNGGYDNVYPDGKVRRGQGKKGRFTPKDDNKNNKNSNNKNNTPNSGNTNNKTGNSNTKKIETGTIAKTGLAIAGIGLIAFTLIEDVATGGVGIADDPATISSGIGMIIQAFA